MVVVENIKFCWTLIKRKQLLSYYYLHNCIINKLILHIFIIKSNNNSFYSKFRIIWFVLLSAYKIFNGVPIEKIIFQYNITFLK